jgi:2-keto-3-deoxy-L-fuconate dehydrogenase
MASNEIRSPVMANSTIFTSPKASTLAVVTGASSGIGQALATALLDRGLDVIAIDRTVAHMDPRARCFALDVRDEWGMAELAARFADHPVSHVFANAGIGGVQGDLLDLPDEAWQWAWEVNVLGAMRTLRLWWPNLLVGRGKAVATLSAAALQSFPGLSTYRATKAALLAALEGLYYQAKGTGVGVHALCPGVVRSDIGNLARYPEAACLLPRRSDTPSAFEAHMAAALKGAQTPTEFAQGVLVGLDQGAPFYWLTHPETRAWVKARHQSIEDGQVPFNDIGEPA